MIEVKHVSYSYKLDGMLIQALDDLNFSIAKGDFVAIQGPSGSGKSTLLYLLGALLEPDSGEVNLFGHSLSQLSKNQKAELRNQKIGYVFQQFHLLPKATVLQNILLPTQYPSEIAKPSDAHKQKAIELATQLGLGDRLNHLPNQLSGGQQQRVAIARALIQDPLLILADEPTGNLDSTTSQEILDLLTQLNREGRTIVLITHDRDVAKQCKKTIEIRDGKIVSPTFPVIKASDTPKDKIMSFATSPQRLVFTLFPQVFSNLKRHRARTFLTLIGIVIGIAAVLSMITLGQFAKRKIIDSYADLGVNTLMFGGYRNYRLKATDQVSTQFQSFNWVKDLLPLKRIFPNIEYISPMLMSWGTSVSFGGRSVDKDAALMGVSDTYDKIANRKILAGSFLSPGQVEARSNSCVIGFEIAKKLFNQTSPIGKTILISNERLSMPCRVIGVLTSKKSNSEWMKPDNQILVPFTYMEGTMDYWQSRIFNVLISVRPGSPIENSGKSVKGYFEQRYGKSISFWINSDSTLLEQMGRFLTLFTALLATIAFLSLLVGGIGITNMMLVSLSERLKEIGLRKALGATDYSIRVQFLLESTVTCVIAGLFGILLGFATYQFGIYAASRFIKSLPFEWIVDPMAILVSAISILAVGVLSGLVPALRAEKLQVIEALRTE